MTKQRQNGVLAIAAVAMLTLAVGCQKEKTPEAAIQTVRVGQIQEVRPDTAERYSATISASGEINLAFKSPGLIEKILQVKGADGRVRDVQPGDKITEGDELAVVRRIDYEHRVQEALEQVHQAEAQLAQTDIGVANAEQDFTRAGNLYRNASLTKPEYDHAKAAYDSAKAQAEGVRALIAKAKLAVSEANLSLGDTSLKAPFSGWLIARNVERGSLVGNSTVGFTIVDTRVVKANFAVPDTTLKSIRLGGRLTIMLTALAHPVSGVVTSVSPQADLKTRVFTVEVSIPNPRDEIRPGMIGSIVLGPDRDPVARLAAPLSAVVRAPGNANGFAIYRIEDRGGKSYVAAQPVTLGDTFGNSIQVTSGVKAGERIVALGGELLRNGEEVRVLP